MRASRCRADHDATHVRRIHTNGERRARKGRAHQLFGFCPATTGGGAASLTGGRARMPMPPHSATQHPSLRVHPCRTRAIGPGEILYRSSLASRAWHPLRGEGNETEKDLTQRTSSGRPSASIPRVWHLSTKGRRYVSRLHRPATSRCTVGRNKRYTCGARKRYRSSRASAPALPRLAQSSSTTARLC